MDDSRDQQQFEVPDNVLAAMVRTRAAAAGDGITGAGHNIKNKNSAPSPAGESPDDNSKKKASAFPPPYREGTPPDQLQQPLYPVVFADPYTAAHSTSQQAEAEQRQPPSPMVTPPIRSYNAAQGSRSGMKKPPPAVAPSAGVPHVYHDYSRVPDETNYVRKKTGGVSK